MDIRVSMPARDRSHRLNHRNDLHAVEGSLFLAYLVPPEVQEFHQEFNSRLSQRIPGYPAQRGSRAHTTIKSQVHVPASLVADADALLREKIRTGNIFPVRATICKVKLFDPIPKRKRLVYVEVGGEHILSQTNYILSELEAVGIPRGRYEGKVPHISLAKNLNEDEVECALKIANQMTLPTCTQYTLDTILFSQRVGNSETYDEFLKIPTR